MTAELLLILFVNLIVGICIGLTGIAGFLLPMFYTGFLGMSSVSSLALSFAAFLVSGILGSMNYKKSGNLDLKTGLLLSSGSLVGAILGVLLNRQLPEAGIRMLLYLVVLGSGISILIREWRSSVAAAAGSPARSGGSEKTKAGEIACPAWAYALLGFLTGAVCSASGAGGPVLVMPLLTLLGIPAHTAVGISLFNSIFIAIPSTVLYLGAASGGSGIWPLLPGILLFHAAGVFAGSRNASRINQTLLKRIVAAASIAIACLKLAAG